jgi:hypothetical protein
VTTGNREASELVIARLTEESISAELKIAGLPAVTIVRAAAAYSPANITLYIIIGNPHICALCPEMPEILAENTSPRN